MKQLSFTAVVLLTACGSSHVGVWESDVPQVGKSTYHFKADGTFSASVVFSTPGGMATNGIGTYSVSGDRLSMDFTANNVRTQAETSILVLGDELMIGALKGAGTDGIVGAWSLESKATVGETSYEATTTATFMSDGSGAFTFATAGANATTSELAFTWVKVDDKTFSVTIGAAVPQTYVLYDKTHLGPQAGIFKRVK